MTSLLTFILIGVARRLLGTNALRCRRLRATHQGVRGGREDWLKKYHDVKPDAADDVWETRDREWPGWAFIPRFLDLAAQTRPRVTLSSGSSTGRPTWASVTTGSPRTWTCPSLLSGPHFREEERLVDACRQALIYPAPWTERYLREVLDRAKGQVLRGNACLA